MRINAEPFDQEGRRKLRRFLNLVRATGAVGAAADVAGLLRERAAAWEGTGRQLVTVGQPPEALTDEDRAARLFHLLTRRAHAVWTLATVARLANVGNVADARRGPGALRSTAGVPHTGDTEPRAMGKRARAGEGRRDAATRGHTAALTYLLEQHSPEDYHDRRPVSGDIRRGLEVLSALRQLGEEMKGAASVGADVEGSDASVPPPARTAVLPAHDQEPEPVALARIRQIARDTEKAAMAGEEPATAPSDVHRRADPPPPPAGGREEW